MTTDDLTNHDQRLSFAVAQVIAKLRNGGEVRVLGLPDVDERVNPAVELLTVDAIGELAIEHTLIEPFEEVGLPRFDGQVGCVDYAASGVAWWWMFS